MSRGGARAGSGPAPDPMSLRTAHRRARGEVVAPGWIVLPVTGRPGDPPEWPLTAATERELVHWARLWAKPQATQWERLGVDLDVALYVRRLVAVEQPDASAAAGSLLIRMEEALGLSIPGLQARKWQLGAPDGPPATVTTIYGAVTAPGDQFSARDRMARAPYAEETD